MSRKAIVIDELPTKYIDPRSAWRAMSDVARLFSYFLTINSND